MASTEFIALSTRLIGLRITFPPATYELYCRCSRSGEHDWYALLSDNFSFTHIFSPQFQFNLLIYFYLSPAPQELKALTWSQNFMIGLQNPIFPSTRKGRLHFWLFFCFFPCISCLHLQSCL